jgi:hypothetical protein
LQLSFRFDLPAKKAASLRSLVWAIGRFSALVYLSGLRPILVGKEVELWEAVWGCPELGLEPKYRNETPNFEKLIQKMNDRAWP